MKLIVAVVQDEDADNLVAELVAAEYRVTRICSTGSLLRTGNTSLLIGVDDYAVPRVLGIINRVCQRRTRLAVPYAPALEPGLLYLGDSFEVEVGGAVVFVANVERFERL
ncbi:MAG: cyclic-di-AMP receptor [Sphaerobacter sp.]|nr:cyclic-di-AMP receptor [Sphaerobacter sp.]